MGTKTGDAHPGFRSAGGVGFRVQPGEEDCGLGPYVSPLSSDCFPPARGDLGAAPRVQCRRQCESVQSVHTVILCDALLCRGALWCGFLLVWGVLFASICAVCFAVWCRGFAFIDILRVLQLWVRPVEWLILNFTS